MNDKIKFLKLPMKRTHDGEKKETLIPDINKLPSLSETPQLKRQPRIYNNNKKK